MGIDAHPDRSNGTPREPPARRHFTPEQLNLQRELVIMQDNVRAKGLKVVVIFEARDGSRTWERRLRGGSHSPSRSHAAGKRFGDIGIAPAGPGASKPPQECNVAKPMARSKPSVGESARPRRELSAQTATSTVMIGTRAAGRSRCRV